MPGRNLKTIQCGCVIDHAEAPNRGQQPSVSPQSPGWSVSCRSSATIASVAACPAVNLRFVRHSLEYNLRVASCSYIVLKPAKDEGRSKHERKTN